jgi:N-acetyl-gamma-glutamyl-phosphate reductase
VVFFATPHGVAMAQAPELLAAGVKVIDLAADFRIKDRAVFEQWYKIEHTCPELLEEAAYGLAELNREAISKSPSGGQSGLLPDHHATRLLPAAQSRRDRCRRPDCRCKSGVSGAGRKAEIGTLFSESSDNLPMAWPVTATRQRPWRNCEIHQRAGGAGVHPASGTYDTRHALDAVRPPDA